MARRVAPWSPDLSGLPRRVKPRRAAIETRSGRRTMGRLRPGRNRAASRRVIEVRPALGLPPDSAIPGVRLQRIPGLKAMLRLCRFRWRRPGAQAPIPPARALHEPAPGVEAGFSRAAHSRPSPEAPGSAWIGHWARRARLHPPDCSQPSYPASALLTVRAAARRRMHRASARLRRADRPSESTIARPVHRCASRPDLRRLRCARRTARAPWQIPHGPIHPAPSGPALRRGSRSRRCPSRRPRAHASRR